MDLRRVKGMCFHQNRIGIFLEHPLPIEINEREDGEQGPLFRKNIVCRNIFIPFQKPLSTIHVTILLRERGYFYLPRSHLHIPIHPSVYCEGWCNARWL
ncbi:hypothetical protein CDAR_497771 [Caerostris darwini]|uniref:Uncharacterized protein n=1 Tax=Caerostris darwini TaxID=1538125 RepID=A0AAV4PTF4_9ARAC|nr:hypothetical protein CDAR_497771 [Caerostris darwini]